MLHSMTTGNLTTVEFLQKCKAECNIVLDNHNLVSDFHKKKLDRNQL